MDGRARPQNVPCYQLVMTNDAHLYRTKGSRIVPVVHMKLKQCIGGLSPEEIQQLERETELKLHTCYVCGRRNLYAIRDNLGKWVPEPHDEPIPRSRRTLKKP